MRINTRVRKELITNMKAIITNTRINISREDGHRMTGEILFLDPLNSAHLNGAVEIYPDGFLEKFSDIQKGDEVKYQFIRGAQGSGPETSLWMKVKKVDGEMITTSNNGQYGPYEFRVLRCQITEHKSKNPSKKTTTPKDESSIKLVDPLLDLRKQIERFNLR